MDAALTVREQGLPKGQRCNGRSWYQRGAYALEFALVFPLLFILIYALLTFGLIMTAQQSLNFAAESGVRAALVAPGPDLDLRDLSPAGREQALRTRLDSRVAQARSEASAQVRWLSDWVGSEHVRVSAASIRNEVRIDIVYDYGHAPLVPMLGPKGLFALVVPARLQGQAQANLQAAGELGALL
ncbi:MAG TPA: pilus assembly protein [Alcaligenes faecalis]|nr:pilus assembly protein [Alcaligenes faecalis]